MSRPIHSVKHIQTSYRKYQWIALSCATFTIVTVIMAALSSVHLSNLGKSQTAAVKQNQIASSSMEGELKKLKSQIATLESQLSEEKSGNDQLDRKNKLLQKKLADAQQALEAKSEDRKSLEVSPSESSEAVDTVPVDTEVANTETPMEQNSIASLPMTPDQSDSVSQTDLTSVTAEKEKSPTPRVAADPMESSRVQ